MSGCRVFSLVTLEWLSTFQWLSGSLNRTFLHFTTHLMKNKIHLIIFIKYFLKILTLLEILFTPAEGRYVIWVEPPPRSSTPTMPPVSFTNEPNKYDSFKYKQYRNTNNFTNFHLINYLKNHWRNTIQLKSLIQVEQLTTCTKQTKQKHLINAMSCFYMWKIFKYKFTKNVWSICN